MGLGTQLPALSSCFLDAVLIDIPENQFGVKFGKFVGSQSSNPMTSSGDQDDLSGDRFFFLGIKSLTRDSMLKTMSKGSSRIKSRRYFILLEARCSRSRS